MEQEEPEIMQHGDSWQLPCPGDAALAEKKAGIKPSLTNQQTMAHLELQTKE